MSVEPTPNAKQPSAPAMHVCESVPATSCPGSAISSITLLWQMASEPDELAVAVDLAVELHALLLA